MTQYSCIALSPRAFIFRNPRVVLDEGRNIFNLITDNIEEVLFRLKQEGVTVLRADVIAQDPVPLSSLALPNESLQDLLQEA